MLDANEAPEGYYAVEEESFNSCEGCALVDDEGYCAISSTPCYRMDRKDKTNAIFKEKGNK